MRSLSTMLATSCWTLVFLQGDPANIVDGDLDPLGTFKGRVPHPWPCSARYLAMLCLEGGNRYHDLRAVHQV